MNSAFSVTKHDRGDGVAVLAVCGEIDRDVSAALTTIIANAVGQPGVTGVEVDLLRASFLAAAGIRALLAGRAVAERRALPYRVSNAGGVTRAVLDAAGLLQELEATAPHHPPRARALSLRG